jgi:hypothetical protein
VIVAAGDPPSWLELNGPPSAAGSARLDDVLTALAGPAWRERAGTLALPELLARLTGLGAMRDPAARGLLVDTPASFLVLRPEADAAPSPTTLRLESVYVDGREVGPSH